MQIINVQIIKSNNGLQKSPKRIAGLNYSNLDNLYLCKWLIAFYYLHQALFFPFYPQPYLHTAKLSKKIFLYN